MTRLLHPPEGVHAFTVGGADHGHDYDGENGVDCPACVAAVDGWPFDQRGGWRIEEEPLNVLPDIPAEVSEKVLFGADPFAEGKAAAEEGLGRSANPYDGRSKAGKAWSEGWDAAEK